MQIMGRRLQGRFRWSRGFRVLRRFGPALRQEHKGLWLGGLGAVGVAVAEVARPWPLKWVLDYVLLDREASPPWHGLAAWMRENQEGAVLAAAAAMVFFVVARNVSSYLENVSLLTAAQRLVFRIRNDLFSHIQRLSLDFHDRHRTGDLLARLTGDVNLVSETLSGSVLAVVSTVLLIGMVLGIMAWMDPMLAIVAAAVVPILVIALSRLVFRLRSAVREQRKNESRLVSSVHEILSGAKIIQAFGREEAETRKYEKSAGKTMSASLKVRRLQVAVQVTTLVILAVGMAVVLVWGRERVAAGSLTPGDLMVFLAYLESIQGPIERITKRFARFTKAIACGERIVEVLDTEPGVRDRDTATPAPALSGEIVFDDITFGYSEESDALRQVSFRVGRGERVVLMGSSGSGKTTLVNLLLRFYEPTRGRILLDGRDIRDYTIASVRSQVATLLQEPLLFGASIRDNIAYGKPTATMEEIRQAAQTAGILDFVEQLPAGFDTPIAEEGGSLSGGQRRLVAMARAVLRTAPILVLDEPTAGLDANTEAQLGDAIRRITSGRTTIVIAHHLANVVDADRIVYLHRGQIVASGTHQELYENVERYRQLCEIQFGGQRALQVIREKRAGAA